MISPALHKIWPLSLRISMVYYVCFELAFIFQEQQTASPEKIREEYNPFLKSAMEIFPNINNEESSSA